MPTGIDPSDKARLGLGVADGRPLLRLIDRGHIHPVFGYTIGSLAGPDVRLKPCSDRRTCLLSTHAIPRGSSPGPSRWSSLARASVSSISGATTFLREGEVVLTFHDGP